MPEWHPSHNTADQLQDGSHGLIVTHLRCGSSLIDRILQSPLGFWRQL
jgi:hypothetical protein